MEYKLIRAYKRSLSLQVNAQGLLIARAPMFMPKFLIDKFVRDKSSWIEKRIKEQNKPQPKKIEHFTHDSLKIYIEQEILVYSKRMALRHTGLRFTQVASYWGTCAPSGILSFNLALCFTPPGVVSYVVVHEMAHLRWKGHGKRFWEMVHKYYPQTKEMRAILRKIPRSL